LYLDSDPDDANLPFRLCESGIGPGVQAGLPVDPLASSLTSRLWLPSMDYRELIRHQMTRFGLDEQTACKRFGELVVPQGMLDHRSLVWSPEMGAYRKRK
jgi:hypothetical protein